MILTNQQIFKYSQDIVNNFSKIDKYYPAKFNFYLQKNLKALMNGVDEIEQSRNKRFNIMEKKRETMNILSRLKKLKWQMLNFKNY